MTGTTDTTDREGRIARWWRVPWVLTGLCLAVLLTMVVTGPEPRGAPVREDRGSRPCDIYGDAGTPCVAAHSTTRALFASYAGPLYEVRRSRDGATTDIGLLEPGGFADSARQDAFCAGTVCVVTVIHDQSARHNDLTIEGPGTAGGQDVGAKADALPVTAGGHRVYGLYVSPGTGYRHHVGDGVARDGQPEGMYMVASGTHVNSGCCFDYGNVEAEIADLGNGHMDAVNLGTTCYFEPCTGEGPWVAADLENGLFHGAHPHPADLPSTTEYVTAMLKNDGQSRFALHSGDGRRGRLTTIWDGALPPGGYSPMQQEGSIVLGTGGDNSNASIGTFFEGVMTAGYPSDAADAAVQADIVSVGYAGSTSIPPSARIVPGPGGTCLDVLGDDTAGRATPVALWDCQSYADDQHWTFDDDRSLVTLGRCLQADAEVATLEDCTGSARQRWVRHRGALVNPFTGQCLSAPVGTTDNGTPLRLEACDAGLRQRFG